MKKTINIFLLVLLFPIFAFAEGGSNNPQVTLTPDSRSVVEGDSGKKTLNFTVEISECPTLSAIKINVKTFDQTAKKDLDYVPVDQSITFAPSSCVKTRNVKVEVKGDTEVEPDETFILKMLNDGTSGVQQFRWGNQVSQITIENDDDENEEKADLAITKTNDKAPNKAQIGDEITYTIVAENKGPKSTKVYVWDTFPKNLEFISVEDSINGFFGFLDTFNCEYKSNANKVQCKGDYIFDKGDKVTITVKAKVKNTTKYTTNNYAGIKSNSKPAVEDSDTSNNRVKSTFYVKQIDLEAKKWVKKNGKYINDYDNPPSFDIGDNIRYKIQIKNKKTHPAQIQLWDTIPDGLQIQSVEVEGNPSDYQCDINNNQIYCHGSKVFTKGIKQNIFINVKATQENGYINGVWVETQDDNIYYDKSKINNWDEVPIYVGTDSDNEKVVEFKKTINNPKSEYRVNDIIEFKVSVKTHGMSSKYMIRDWENANDTTPDAFEFLSVTPQDNSLMNCSIENPNDPNEKFINCETTKNVDTNKELAIYIRAKLKQDGRVCNTAHVYKEYISSNGRDYKWMGQVEKCLEVAPAKKPPILDVNEIHVQLDKDERIDLKDYTIDDDTPVQQLKYSLVSGSLPSGFTLSEDGILKGKYTDSSGKFPKKFDVTVKVVDPDGLSTQDDFTIVVDAAKIDAINNYYTVAVNNTLTGNFITDKTASTVKEYEPDIGEGLKVIQVVNPDDLNLTWQSDGSFTYTASNQEGEYHITYTVEDKYGQQDTATVYFNVFKPNIKANDDIFEVAKNTPLHANVFEDNGNGVDVGEDIKVISYTQPSHGTLYIKKNGNLVFTPEQDYSGTDTFTYTIKDKYNQKSSANVLLKIGVKHVQGYMKFELVNPPESRNLIGNYVVAGNTLSCITNKDGLKQTSNPYSGVCQRNRKIANNDYIVKYIDIDNSSATWNSSSAKFELPTSYLELEKGKGVVWAGLFWQGSINNRDEGYPQRRAYESGSSFRYEDITQSSPIDIASTDADKILIKIDNHNYVKIKADTLYYDTAHGDYGGYYAAYKNVTQLLQDANLSKGEHTVTVANLTTNEGREAQVGNYGGWTLVVIYKEDFSGKPRNVSIYNGYQPLGFGGNTYYPEKEITITGFKLPKSGDVDAQISAFVGEGEEKYGGTPLIYDKMYIKDIDLNKTYDMPVAHPNNIFDGAISNNKETPIPNQTNTNGIDIDSYDVSNIIRKIRDNKKDTSEIIIGLVSKDEDNQGLNESDYVTASMLAFSTELYAPKMCYDYNIRLGEFVNVPSEDREFEVDNYLDDKLQLKLMIKSQEADFDLIESKLYATFTPKNVFEYVPGSAKYSPPNTIDYLPAIETDVKKGEIAIGNNVTIEGGVIGEKEITYAKLYYDFDKSFVGKFDIFINSKISFDGVTKVPYEMSTAAPKNSIFFIDRCPTNPTYDPVYGMLNVERGDSSFSQPPNKRYALYTQVTGVPYEISLAAYQKDSDGNYTLPLDLNLIAEVELIDAGTFENNASAGYDSVCQDPDTYHGGAFVTLNNNSRAKISIPQDYENYPENLAIRNAAFRSWILTVKDKNGTRRLATYPPQMPGTQFMPREMYFRALHKLNYLGSSYEKDYCLHECTTQISTNSCYQCLRKHYGMPICSRDNFSIRPNSYSIALSDSNETTGFRNALRIGINDGANVKNIAAGYIYGLEVNATRFKYGAKSRESVIGYTFRNNNSRRKAQLNFLTSSLNCEDNSSYDLNLLIRYGKTPKGKIKTVGNTTIAGRNTLIADNAGKYAIHIEDRAWTEVDQVGYRYRPFPSNIDCIKDSSDVEINKLNAIRGCVITNDNTPDTWPDFVLKSHPYSFDLSNLSVDSNPNNGKEYIYINNLRDTLNNYTGNYSDIMALVVKGAIAAKGKNGKVLTNYTDGCMAEDTNITLEYLLDNNTALLTSSSNSVNIQSIVYAEEVDNNATLNNSNLAKNQGDINVSFNKRYFYNSGEAVYGHFINFNRAYNDPINPFRLTLKKISISSPKELINANLQSNFIPKGFADLNSTKTFYYAKVKSKRDFYDDITADEVITPIEVDIYCDKSLDYCKKYGIDINASLTNEYNWWRNLNHTASDGKVYLEANKSEVSVIPSEISSFIKGIDKNVKVKVTGNLERPALINIEPTSNMVNNYSYLLYNKSLNSVPSYIYKVRFVTLPSAWSGEGKTGYTVDENKSSGKRTKRIDW